MPEIAFTLTKLKLFARNTLKPPSGSARIGICLEPFKTRLASNSINFVSCLLRYKRQSFH
jgi:hypothetical protein